MIDLETLEAEAKRRLDPAFFDYVAGGSEAESTLEDNESAWNRFVLRPHVLRDVTQVRTATTLLGNEVGSPIAVAPVAMLHQAWEKGGVATAEGAALADSLFVMGLFGAGSASEVASASGASVRWLQLYMLKDRARSVAAAQRLLAEGYSALVLTVDVARQGNRLRDRRNDWTFRDEGRDDAGDPNEIFDQAFSFDDLAHLCSEIEAPIVVKGVLRGDDAQQCVAAGARAIVVSNHGGRQLDGCVASADALEEVVSAVGDRAEVYVDGGVRSGTHVLKALALGARAVFVGRPVMWGLSVQGAGGVHAVLETLRSELERNMALCGVTRVDEIQRDLVSRRSD